MQTLCCCNSIVAANNVPILTVEGNGTLRHQWIVSQESSVSFTTSDVDGDTVTVTATSPPSGSTLAKVAGSTDAWEFKWTPANTDSVTLV